MRPHHFFFFFCMPISRPHSVSAILGPISSWEMLRSVLFHSLCTRSSRAWPSKSCGQFSQISSSLLQRDTLIPNPLLTPDTCARESCAFITSSGSTGILLFILTLYEPGSCFSVSPVSPAPKTDWHIGFSNCSLNEWTNNQRAKGRGVYIKG